MFNYILTIFFNFTSFIPFCVESINIFIVKIGNAWLIDKYLFLQQLKLPERVHVHYSLFPIQRLCECQSSEDGVTFREKKKIYIYTMMAIFSIDVLQRDNYVIAYLFCYIYKPYNNGTRVRTTFTVNFMLMCVVCVCFFFFFIENAIESYTHNFTSSIGNYIMSRILMRAQCV